VGLVSDRARPPKGGSPPAPEEISLPALEDPLEWWSAPFTRPLPEKPIPTPEPGPDNELPPVPGFEAREAGNGRPIRLVVLGGLLGAGLLIGVGYLIWRRLPSRYLPA
jgi:hypothetical protein